MKAIITLAILVSGITAGAQSLKETLYSGKLKTDTGTVIRKGEDLTSKIDTTTKKPVAEKPRITVAARDSALAKGDSSVLTMDTSSSELTMTADSAAAVANGPKDNNRVWKDYIEELITLLRTEVMPSKKIKSGNYSVLLEYEIGTDGQVTVSNVSASPESSFLEEQIRNRITLTAPQLTPLLGTTGKPRKALKKQIITIAK